MDCLNHDFLVKYFSINQILYSDNFYGKPYFRPPEDYRPGWFNLKTYSVRVVLEKGDYTIDFFIKALIFSLILKVIYRFLPENHIYCWDSFLCRYTYYYYESEYGSIYKSLIYKHKFSIGSDTLIQNLSKRYGSGYDYTSKIDSEIDNYAEFTKTILFDELDPVCITSLKDSFSWIINHEEFKSEFSEDPLSFSNKFYNSLKSKL